MNYIEFKENFLEKNSYVIQGDESALIIEAEKLIKSRLLLQGSEIDVSLFDDENFNINDFLCCVNQLPFFSDKRMVILKNIVKLNDNDKDQILDYLHDQNKSCILLFIDNLNNGVFKDFEKFCLKVECNKLSENKLVEFIVDSLKKEEKKISTDDARMIINLCYSNLELIKNELVKLNSYGEKEITSEIITNLVPVNLEYEVYELTNALGVKDADKSLKILTDMLKNNNNAIGLISNYFRRMFFSLISDDLSSLEISKIFKVKEFAIVKARQQASKFGAKNLKAINELLLEVDYLIKCGKMQQENAVYYLVFNILTK